MTTDLISIYSLTRWRDAAVTLLAILVILLQLCRTRSGTKCKTCGDTGSIDTGNNDLPCHCPMGAKAKFNHCSRLTP